MLRGCVLTQPEVTVAVPSVGLLRAGAMDRQEPGGLRTHQTEDSKCAQPLHAIVPAAYAWYPIGTAVFFLVAFLLLFFLGGSLFNVCSGLRGTAAIPLYNYFSASMYGSDYALKTG